MKMTIQRATQLMRVFFLKQKRLPTYAEFAQLCGYQSKFSCVRLVKKLIAADLITKDNQGKLLPKNLFAIPHVIETGGESVEEQSVANNMFDIYRFFQQFPIDSFSITVPDEAMTAEGIFPGDIVIIDCNRPITNGAIVAASIKNKWVVRYYYKQQKAVVLAAANANYLPIYPTKNFDIGGIVAHVIRNY